MPRETGPEPDDPPHRPFMDRRDVPPSATGPARRLCAGSRIALAAALAAPAAAAARAGDPAPEAVPGLVLREPAPPGPAAARTGVLRVWEDRARRSGRVLELEVVVLPARGPDRAPDPVFVLAGGPGQNAAELADLYADHWFRERRDVVLMSQRGTGGNNRLDCEPPGGGDELQGFLDPLFRVEVFRDCLEGLRRDHDLTKYSTPDAMDDLDDLRRALGCASVNLHGGSYGTRAALEYIRRHGDRVRCAVLNGVAPVGFLNPLHHARSSQEAFDLIAEQCAADPACVTTFGDLRGKLREVLRRLEESPARATVIHPRTGEPVAVTVSREAFAEGLRIAMYSGHGDVPRLIDETASGRFDEFAERALETARALRSTIAMGMLLCVTCSEDVAFIRPEQVAPLTEGTFAGDWRVRLQMAVCDFWPRSSLPPETSTPVVSDVPVLLLSGTLDPVTRPFWGDEAARHLRNGLHLTVPGPHGVGGECVEAIVRDFLERGSAAGLDTSCAGAMTAGPR